MPKLSVKTRGNSSPQGKPRVFFSCHPEDFGAYFEVLSEEILKTQNCAIWYESEWDESEDHVELESQLSQMQLFVVPITTNYLSGDCRAIQFEFGYAMEQHIPVLPIMMEPGLTDYFTERMERIHEGYGKLQFLDRTAEDPSEIPYAEKLEKRLSSILVSDETIKRIQNAFDAYIFLSYRKKDRADAQSLMRLIHSIPEFQDIAIWYDEFLVPGERWSDTIANAMAKSGLVTLAVTEHITEYSTAMGNYISENEYPQALKDGKAVVPAKLAEVDVKKLATLFPGLPALVDGKSMAEMKAAIETIARKENNHDPVHNYLIGLAYLNAIDVERDAEKALNLIIGAAEAELPEAMEKLGTMYRTGEGVTVDFDVALKWQQQVVDAYKDRCSKDPSPRNLRALFSAMLTLGVSLCEMGRSAAAKETFSDASIRAENANDKETLMVFEKKLGETNLALGEPKQAKKHFQRSLSIRKQIMHSRNDMIGLREYAVGLAGMGQFCRATQDWPQAKKYFLESLTIRRRLYEADRTQVSQRDLFTCALKAAETAEGMLQNVEAAKLYHEAHSLAEAAIAEFKSTDAIIGAAACSIGLGRIEMNEGNRSEKARRCFESAIQLLDPVCTEKKIVSAFHMLCNAIEGRIELAIRAEQYEDAGLFAEKMRQTAEAYAGNCVGTDADLMMTASQIKLGDIAVYRKMYAEGLSCYQKALALCDHAIQGRRINAIGISMAEAQYKSGLASALHGQRKQASVWYEKALATLREYQLDKTAKSFDLYVKIYVGIGDLEKDIGDTLKAKNAYQDAIDLAKQAFRVSKSAAAQYNVGVSTVKMGFLLFDTKMIQQGYHIMKMSRHGQSI